MPPTQRASDLTQTLTVQRIAAALDRPTDLHRGVTNDALGLGDDKHVADLVLFSKITSSRRHQRSRDPGRSSATAPSR
jgi:hypothetical protein